MRRIGSENAFENWEPTEVDASNRFFGVSIAEGKRARLVEKPWHKMAATMFATGKVTIKAVAASCGVTQAAVSTLLKNPWFQKTVIQLMEDANGPSVLDLFKAEQINSLLTLVEIRDDAKAPSNTRRQSAVDILDRAMGKPIQRIESDNTVRSGDPIQEAAQLKASIEVKKAELAKAGFLGLVKEEENIVDVTPEDLLPNEQRSCDTHANVEPSSCDTLTDKAGAISETTVSN